MSRVVLRGRSEELGAVLTALRRAARTGSAEMIVITGEPGIGKSALLRAAVEQTSRAGAAVGVGRAEAADQAVSGAPLLLALRSGPSPLLDGEAFAGLEVLYDRQLWLIERISALLEDLAAQRAVVIAIDDVHWADSLTRLALRALVGRLAGSPVVWLLTSRVTPATVVDELVSAAEDLVTVTSLTLDRLTDDDICRLAHDHLGAPPDDSTREVLHGAGGSPFWAMQLLDGLAWRRMRGLPHDDMHAELIDDVRLRLLPLEADTRTLVQYAAVWGRALPLVDAARLLGDLPVARIIRAAHEAADNGLLSSGETGVEFTHALVRDAVYADIDPGERIHLHRSSARHLITDGPNALAAAAHFRVIANPGDDEVIVGLVQAAEDSATTMPDQAAELAEEAFSLLPEGHPGRPAIGRQVLSLLARVQRHGVLVSIAGHLIAGTEDNQTRAELMVQACLALWALGRYGDIETRTGLSLQLDGVTGAVRAQLAAVRALASTRTASAAGAAAAAEAVLASGRQLGDEPAQRMALMALAEAARNEGRHQVVIDRFTDLRAISRTEYLSEEIRTLQHLDRYDEADALLASVRDEAQDDVDRVLPSLLFAQVWQDHNLGRFDAAEAGARALLQLAWEIGNVDYEINARTVLGGVAIYRGDLAGAREMVRPGSRREETSDASRAPGIRLVQGWLLGEEGDYAAGLAILRPLVMAAASGGQAWAWSPPWMRTFAGLGLVSGDVEFTEAAVRIAQLGAERNPRVATLVGTALQVRGVVQADVEILGQAVEVLRQAPRPLLLAQALADHATALHAARATDAAAERMHEAIALFDALGTVPGALAGTAIRETLSARGKPTGSSRRPARGLNALTETERLVADLTAAGHSSRSAATELGVSPNTINTHLRAVFTKLNVRSRVQLSNLLRAAPSVPSAPGPGATGFSLRGRDRGDLVPNRGGRPAGRSPWPAT